jgi:hypothetical protein
MSQFLSVAASLSPAIRQAIGIQVLSRSEHISHLAATHQSICGIIADDSPTVSSQSDLPIRRSRSF